MRKTHEKAGGITAVMLFFLCLAAETGAADLEGIIDGLQESYRSMKDYRARFLQETRIKAYPHPQKSSGEVFYKKPGKMRWNYDEPERREIVTDGKTLWMYTPSLSQVIKTDFDAVNRSRLARVFISGMGDLRKDFRIKLLDSGPRDETFRLLLTPKKEKEALKSIVLTVDGETFNILGTETTDIYDNVTVVKFSDLEMNGEIDDSVFRFKVPEGVEVITSPGMP